MFSCKACAGNRAIGLQRVTETGKSRPLIFRKRTAAVHRSRGGRSGRGSGRCSSSCSGKLKNKLSQASASRGGEEGEGEGKGQALVSRHTGT